MKETQVKNKLSRTQKTGFVLLFVFTILVISLGVLQMRNNIYNPLAVKIDLEQNTFGVSDENVKLQNLDTDQDNINDYEELYFYETSPYLPDTDSDGIGDKEEIDAGTNPNCAEGKVCEDFEGVSNTTSTTNFGPILGNEETVPSQTGELSLEELQTVLQDPQKIRQLLLESGQITEEQLSQIDDTTLMSLVQKMLTESGKQTNP